MYENQFNISISFSYKDKPFRLNFYTTASYNKSNGKKMDVKDLYDENEAIVIGDIQILLSTITNDSKPLFLRNLKVEYEGELVFEKTEYEVFHVPPMSK